MRNETEIVTNIIFIRNKDNIYSFVSWMYSEAVMIELPRRTLSDDDIVDYVQILKIPYFRGVKMRDELPLEVRMYECGVLNLNTHTQKGSHWTCWFKRGKNVSILIRLVNHLLLNFYII